MKNKVLLIALLFYYCPLFAQKDLSDGYVVIFPNDTLRGQIVNKEWRKNPKTITFVSPDNTTKEYTPLQIRSFGLLSSGERYESYTVSMDLGSIDDKEIYAHNSNPITVQDTTVFLSVLVEGRANLLYFFDKNSKHHYYLRMSNENAPQELIYKKALVETNNEKKIGVSNEYQAQLSILSDCSQLKSFDRLEYSQHALIKVVNQYNNCFGQKSGTILRKDQETSEISLILGGNYSFETQTPYRNYTFNIERFRPAFGIGLDLLIPRTRGRLRVGADAIYQAIGDKDIDLSYASYINLDLGVKYNIFNSSKFAIYANGGYGIFLRMSSNQTNALYERPLELSGIYLGIGASRKKFKLELRYEDMFNSINWLLAATKAYNINLLLKYRIK